jgi:Fic family protein
MDVANRRVWILTTERPVDRRTVFIANYWPAVAMVLRRYAPARVSGLGAVKLHLEEFSSPEELVAVHSANQSAYTIPLEAEFRLRLKPRSDVADGLTIAGPEGAQIPCLSGTQLLATLGEDDVAAGVESVSAWLRHLVVRTPELEAAITDSTRAVSLKRLADLADTLRNAPLGRQLEAAARRQSGRHNSPARTGVGSRIPVPPAIQQLPRGTGSPWMDEQAVRLARQEAEIDTFTGTEAKELPSFPWDALQTAAEQVKAYDAYHSTAMEGHRISREISDAIVAGQPLPGGLQDQQTLQAAMAVQGYSIASNEVLLRARRKAPVDADLILDLYESLFRPSVDAGITHSAALRGWRTSSAGLRGWRYIPPNAKKIPDLVGGLERFAARPDLSPVARAMLVHLEFVTVHPFMDGNGRLGRLLMNHVLLSAGRPWVTIRSDERVPFFRAMEQAQVDGDTNAFIRFLWHLIRESALQLDEKRARTRTARRRQSPVRKGR